MRASARRSTARSSGGTTRPLSATPTRRRTRRHGGRRRRTRSSRTRTCTGPTRRRRGGRPGRSRPRTSTSAARLEATSPPRVKNRPRHADLVGVAMGIKDGARLMRASFDVVRRDRALLWFPVISTGCLALTAGFWIFEGAWLYAVRSPGLLYVPLVVAGLYSLAFVGVFFSVALAGAAAQ